MEKKILKIDDLKTHLFTKRGIIKAVDGVNLSLGEQETLGLVGESGCGKSMTCLSILKLEPKPAAKIVSGKIIFEGEDLVLKGAAEMRKIRGKRISVILQDPNNSLNPAYTIGNQICEVIRLHQQLKGRAAREKAIDALKQCRIPAPDIRFRAFPHMLSGGMRQRAAGAIAISCYPSLLIADEPTTALDVTTQFQYLHLLKEIQNEMNSSLIFITHDLGIVAQICDRVAVMYMGKIIEEGDVKDIWDNPLHPYTSGLMNSIPEMERKVERLFSIRGKIPSHFDLPKGCTFHPRCDEVMEKCREEFPPKSTLGDNHSANCWRLVR